MAVLSYHSFEQSFLRLKKWFTLYCPGTDARLNMRPVLDYFPQANITVPIPLL